MAWVLPIAMAALDLGTNMWGASKAKKEAEEANRKARQQAAIMNLISVAGGRGPVGMPSPQSVPSSFDPRMISSAVNTGMRTYSLQEEAANRDYQKGLEQARLGATPVVPDNNDQIALNTIAQAANDKALLLSEAQRMQAPLIESEVAKNNATAGYYSGAKSQLDEQTAALKREGLVIQKDKLANEVAKDGKAEVMAQWEAARKSWLGTGDPKYKKLMDLLSAQAINGSNVGPVQSTVITGASIPAAPSRLTIGAFQSE